VNFLGKTKYFGWIYRMLKISIKDSHTRRLLVLEGKIIAPWTDELSKAACQNLVSHLAGRELVIDLQGVTDISADGEEALYCLMVQGAKFRGGGVFIRQVLKQLARRVRRNDSL
jgi:anti-anti-sigma regulatory factor